MFGRRESEGKGEKMREKKKNEKVESFSGPKFYCIKVVLYRSLLRLIYFLEQGKLQKCMKYHKYIEGSFGKSYKKLVKVGQIGRRSRLRNSAGCEIFATLQNFCSVPNSTLFAPFSF